MNFTTDDLVYWHNGKPQDLGPWYVMKVHTYCLTIMRNDIQRIVIKAQCTIAPPQ
jgi:hypothetical protein